MLENTLKTILIKRKNLPIINNENGYILGMEKQISLH